MRYLLHESDHPISTDYYYECRKTTNDHFPRVLAHTHDYYEIYIYLSGSVMLFIEDRIYKVKRGDIIVIPPYTIHQLLPTSEEQLNDEYDRTYMYITPACLSSFQFNEHSLLEPFELAKENVIILILPIPMILSAYFNVLWEFTKIQKLIFMEKKC